MVSRSPKRLSARKTQGSTPESCPNRPPAASERLCRPPVRVAAPTGIPLPRREQGAVTNGKDRDLPLQRGARPVLPGADGPAGRGGRLPLGVHLRPLPPVDRPPGGEPVRVV